MTNSVAFVPVLQKDGNDNSASGFAGVFLIDKPEGPSSFAIIRDVRRLLGIKKVGHAGTLDPFASGLLVVCVGRSATKLISKFMDGDKEYIATMRLGIETTTQDPEGEIISQKSSAGLCREDIAVCLSSFIGEQMQIPPAYSALKYKGKPLYHYARQGIQIEKEPRPVQIHEIAWLNDDMELGHDTCDVVFRVSCSKGTYIRTLAADIGKALGCGAYLAALRRTRSGVFHVNAAFCGADLKNRDCLEHFKMSSLSLDEALQLLQ